MYVRWYTFLLFCFSFLVCSVSLFLSLSLFLLCVVYSFTYAIVLCIRVSWSCVYKFCNVSTQPRTNWMEITCIHSQPKKQQQQRIRLHTPDNRFSVFIRTFYVCRFRVEYLYTISCIQMWADDEMVLFLFQFSLCVSAWWRCRRSKTHWAMCVDGSEYSSRERIHSI